MKTDWQPVNDDIPCRKCGVPRQIERREWHSSCGGFVDLNYHCKACHCEWWIEDGDS